MTPQEMAALHGRAFVNPRPWSEAEIAVLLASPLCFVVTEPQGFLIGRALAGEAELLTVAVEPAAQGRGIGTRLVRRFLDEARGRGAEQAFLEVAADNAAGLACYHRAGFAEQGRRRGYYGGVDAVVMTCTLAGETPPLPPNP